MPSAQNKIQIVDTHEASETLAVTRLQRVGYQINRTLLLNNTKLTTGGLMRKFRWPNLIGMSLTAALLAPLTTPIAMAQGKKKEMSCKLQSDKVKGKERMCLYVCEDKSLEGRTRKPESTCPSFINSTRS
jgi:hypothetical protein